jgi:antitoxin component YwqK of YwqJK toxin-antitoxin module
MTTTELTELRKKHLPEDYKSLSYTTEQFENDHLIIRGFENNQLKYVLSFKDGVKDGIFEVYYDNGQLNILMNYVNGKKDGLYETWYEDGLRKSSSKFKEGMLISHHFYKSNQLITEAEVVDEKVIIRKWALSGYMIKEYECKYSDIQLLENPIINTNQDITVSLK